MPWRGVLSEAGNASHEALWRDIVALADTGAEGDRVDTTRGLGGVVGSMPAPVTKDARSGCAAPEHCCRKDRRNARPRPRAGRTSRPWRTVAHEPPRSAALSRARTP